MKGQLYCLFFVIFCAVNLSAQNVEEMLKPKSYIKSLFSGFTEAEPFLLSGTFGLNARSYHAWGTDDRQPPFFWMVNANMNISVYKLNIPFSLLITAKNTEASYPNYKELKKAFEDKKNEFNRFGASPYYKWIKLHVGHRNMNFSQYTMNNLTFLGAGVELNPGNYRFAAMYGQLAKAEPVNLSLNEPNLPVFERKGWGVKLGYGTESDFADLIVFKAWDDPNSIPVAPMDSLTEVLPNENLVVSIHAKKQFFKKLLLSVEMASSALTPDSHDGKAKNKFPHPAFLLQARNTTQYHNAINSSLNFQGKGFTIGVGYERIDPDYKSLGSYFFNNDIEDYTINASTGLFQEKLQLQGNIGLQQNNLNNLKTNRVKRFIGSFIANYALDQLSIGANYSNFSSNVEYVLNPELDSLNVVIVTHSTGINASYSLADKNQNQHVITANFDLQQVVDDINDPTQSSASKMLTGNLVYTYALAQSGWRFNLDANYNQNELSQMLVDRIGVGGGISKTLFKNKMNLNYQFTWFSAKAASGVTSVNQALNNQLRVSYQTGQSHSIQFSFGLLSRKTESGGLSTSFKEMVGTLGYGYNFSTNFRKKDKNPEAPGGSN